MRSANAPEISAGVMTANMHWYATNASVRHRASCDARSVPTPSSADEVEAADHAGHASVPNASE